MRLSTMQDGAGPGDGFSWRKYGQKVILGAKYPRWYYRCSWRDSHGCPAIKHVQRTDDDQLLFDVVYIGNHTCTQGAHFQRQPGQEQSSASVGIKAEGNPQVLKTAVDLAVGLVGSTRKTLSKRRQSSQVCVTYTKEDLASYDSHSWRKYGEKDILGHKYPRIYYRCTFRNERGCTATKQEQRTDSDPLVWQVMYNGKHTCADPSVQPSQEQSSVAVGVTASSMSPATSGSHVTYEAVSGSSGAGVRIMSPMMPGSQVTYEDVSRSMSGVCFPETSESQVTYEAASGSSTPGFWSSTDEFGSNDEFDWTTDEFGLTTNSLIDESPWTPNSPMEDFVDLNADLSRFFFSDSGQSSSTQLGKGEKQQKKGSEHGGQSN